MTILETNPSHFAPASSPFNLIHPYDTSKITLPLPPVSSERAYADMMDVYIRFMRHLRCVPNRRMEIRILSALQFTADILDRSDAEISVMLVEMGLRAPRMAFPSDFLRHADMCLMRPVWEFGSAGWILQSLQAHWQKTEGTSFPAFAGEYRLESTKSVFAE
jgi:hypothetical protein